MSLKPLAWPLTWRVIRELGRGSMGSVYEVEIPGREQTVAVKRINIKKANEEVEAHRAASGHINICTLYDVVEQDEELLLVMELGSCDLLRYLLDRPVLSESEARTIFRQMLKAVDHCHQVGISHRDVKLENFLMGRDGRVKLTDFGFAKFLSAKSMLVTRAGSPQYAAPEIWNHALHPAYSVDVWALGVVLYALVFRTLPFTRYPERSLRQAVLAGIPPFPARPSSDCEALLRELMTVCPERRPTLSKVLRSPWLAPPAPMWKRISRVWSSAASSATSSATSSTFSSLPSPSEVKTATI